MLFTEKRLIFMGPDGGAPDKAEAAISQVETDVKSKVDDYKDKDVKELVKKANTKLPSGMSEADLKAATVKIEAAQQRFEKVLAGAKAAVAFGERVKKVDASKDFLHAVDEVKALRTELARLKELGFLSSNTSLDDKERGINTAAKEKYDKLTTSLNNEKGTGDKGAFVEADVTRLMGNLAELQEAKFKDFPGLDTTSPNNTSVADKQAYQAAIKKGLATIEANAKEVKSDARFADNLKQMKFAIDNLDAADQSGSKEHQAGAKEYMEMVLAEQEAKRVWASLSYNTIEGESWRAANINDQVDKGWNQDGPNFKNYNEAVKAYKLGVELSTNKNLGDSGKARDNFKQAADLWRKVLDAQSQQLEGKDKEAYETEYKKFQDAYNALQDKSLVKAEHTSLLTNKEINPEKFKQAMEAVKAANTEITKLQAYLNAIKERYNQAFVEAIKYAEPAKFNPSGVGNVIADFMGNGFYITEVKNEYSNPQIAEMKVLDSLGPFTREQFYAGGNIPYKATATYENGRIKVAIQALNDQTANAQIDKSVNPFTAPSIEVSTGTTLGEGGADAGSDTSTAVGDGAGGAGGMTNEGGAAAKSNSPASGSGGASTGEDVATLVSEGANSTEGPIGPRVEFATPTTEQSGGNFTPATPADVQTNPSEPNASTTAPAADSNDLTSHSPSS